MTYASQPATNKPYLWRFRFGIGESDVARAVYLLPRTGGSFVSEQGGTVRVAFADKKDAMMFGLHLTDEMWQRVVYRPCAP
jgi:hypothetical protein